MSFTVAATMTIAPSAVAASAHVAHHGQSGLCPRAFIARVPPQSKRGSRHRRRHIRPQDVVEN